MVTSSAAASWSPPKECPYDNQLKVYQSVVSNLIYHDADPNVGDTEGIEAFLENHFFQTLRTLGVERALTTVGIDVRVKAVSGNHLAFQKSRSPSYRHAVYVSIYCRSPKRMK